MSEIEITLPTVQYGNVKVRATPEELGLHGIDDAYELGAATAVYLNLFTQGYKVGSAMDVTAPLSASQSEPEQSSQDEEIAHEKAVQALSEGLGGVTELPEHEIGDKVTVGGIEFTKHSETPWAEDGPDIPPTSAPWSDVTAVAPKKKPWETDVTAPAVLDAAW